LLETGMIGVIWALAIIGMVAFGSSPGACADRAPIVQKQAFILVGASAGRSITAGDGIWTFAAQQAAPQNLLLNGAPVADNIVMISIQGSQLHALDVGNNETVWNGSGWTATRQNWIAPGFDRSTRQPIDLRDRTPAPPCEGSCSPRIPNQAHRPLPAPKRGR
jgi:hypothetical protein